MFDLIFDIDKKLFLLINQSYNSWADTLMWIISGKLTWFPLYLLLIVGLWIKARKQFWVLLVLGALSVGLSDLASVHLFKNVFERLRPCHTPDLQNVVHLINNYCGGKYGFVSSHAANSFAIATFFVLLLKKRYVTVSLILWASTVAYSRVYLGVHYPTDVLCGAMLGMLIAWGVTKSAPLVFKLFGVHAQQS